MKKVVVLSDKDNVATCLADLDAGTSIEVPLGGRTRSITLRDPIPFGHKLATRPLAAGEQVLKYGEVIGRASTAIEPGQWVHVHNVESVRARGDNA